MEISALLTQIAAASSENQPDLPDVLNELRRAIAVQEMENARLRTEVAQLAARRGDMLRRVVAAQDERCRRISRELHDEISQSLAAMAIDLETLQANGCITEDETLARLDSLRERLLGALDEVQRIIADLRPAMLEDRGLLSAVERYAAMRLKSSGTHIHTAASDLPDLLPPHVETMLYRIAQEAINNVAQHAEARNVWVSVKCDAGQLELTAVDDGLGFNAEGTLRNSDHHSGVGLLGMRERAALAGGSCVIRSAPGQGTSVVVRIPVPALDAGHPLTG